MYVVRGTLDEASGGENSPPIVDWDHHALRHVSRCNDDRDAASVVSQLEERSNIACSQGLPVSYMWSNTSVDCSQVMRVTAIPADLLLDILSLSSLKRSEGEVGGVTCTWMMYCCLSTLKAAQIPHGACDAGADRSKLEAACSHVELCLTKTTHVRTLHYQYDIARVTGDCRWSLLPLPARRS